MSAFFRPGRLAGLLAAGGLLSLTGCHHAGSRVPAGSANRGVETAPPPSVPAPPPSVPAPDTAQNPPPPLPAGMHAPAFATKTLQGKPLSLASMRGKVVLLDYWATWCGPCRMATPTLESLHKKFGGKGLRVIGMSVDQPDSLADVKPFVKSFGITYRVSAMPAANGDAARAYRVQGIPSQYLIDKKGVVRWSQSGFAPDEGPELDARIRKLLAEN